MASDSKALREGRYELVRRLGEGSQGETWEAIDHGLLRGPRDSVPQAKSLGDQWNTYVARAKATPEGSRPSVDRDRVAIKVFRVGSAKAWKDVELAEREARTLAKLDHPNLPRYIEHFEEDGALYLVMEKIEGESLGALRSKKRGLSGQAAVARMLEDIGGALRYLHGQSPFIVHRDIKPGNIIHRPDGSFALVDFGAVRDRLKVGGGSTVVGTFGYMAPEQFQGRASPKSDLYGLGATALAMLTGVEPEDLPHEGLGIDVPRALGPSAPRGLVRALSAMLTPDPDRRVDTIDEALAFLHEQPRTAPPEAPPVTSTPLSRRERREARREARRVDRDDRRRRRMEARARAAPFIPRVIGHVALLATMLVVWAVVGVAVPLVLTVLSLVFGASLRRAAGRVVAAAGRATKRLHGASRWLSGHREDAVAQPEEPRVRVMAVTPEQAQRIAIREAALERQARTDDADALADEELRREEIEEERKRLLARPLRSSSSPSKRGS